MTARVVVAGIGNAFRHDDGAGPLVAKLVCGATRCATDIGPITEPFDLLGRWDGAALAVVIDATSSGTIPGTFEIIELELGASVSATGESGETRAHSSTHSMGLTGVLRISQALGEAPVRVIVVGIEGSDFSAGLGLSAPVAEVLESASNAVIDIVNEEALKCA